jgi:hypothetical protein
MPNKDLNEICFLINSIFKISHPHNVWNYDIKYDVNNLHPLITITTTLNIEKHDLKNDFAIQ